MNELKVFENVEFGKVRVVLINDKPYMCASDVAKALGYVKPNNAINTKCKYALKQGIPHPQNKDKEIIMDFIPESDIYRLIFGSKLESATKFQDWVFEEVLPTIRKTGGYINNSDLMINTYFGSCDEIEKTILKGLLTNIEEQQKKIMTLSNEVDTLSNEVTRKGDVIIGLTQKIDLAEKRQRISQIVKHGSKKYAERYNLLYSEFNKKYHVDVDRRLENDKQRGNVKMSTNKMTYICDYMDMTNELYDLACKLFEGDFIQLLDEWKDTVTREN